MFGAGKGWFGAKSLWKPKNIHSIEYLKYLYGVLGKNAVVTEHNQQLLIEVWRLISEVLIWGDQNDSKVFDFFLEKNMLTYYISYIRQPSARFIIVQLLQTLNILFENTAQETSIYFLLSNNHVNDIITSEFDFADEEVMAYYISFMKTLSLKLNSHTIHFFFNEHTRNFPLLTEALKFDSHPESMVRIAARTITLNVFRVRNRAVIKFVCDRVAPAQFSIFAYNVSRQTLGMDACLNQAQALLLQQTNAPVPHGTGQQSISSLARARERLQDHAAEHLDLVQYAADVLQLDIEELNAVICPILLSRLLLPVYLPSLLPSTAVAVDQLVENMPRISPLLSLFLLSHCFVVFRGHAPLLVTLLQVLAKGDISTNANIISKLGKLCSNEPRSLNDSLRRASVSRSSSSDALPMEKATKSQEIDSGSAVTTRQPMVQSDSTPDFSFAARDILNVTGTNQTDDEKLSEFTQSFGGRVYLNAIMQFLSSVDNSSDYAPCDREAVFALTLILSIVSNAAFSRDLLNSLGLNSKTAASKTEYNHFLIDKLVTILTNAAKPDTKIRPVTVSLAAELLKTQVLITPAIPNSHTTDSVFASSASPPPPPTSPSKNTCISDHDLARLEAAREESTLVLRSFFKSEDTFVDAFEDEYNHFHDRRRIDVERVLGDTNLLLSPAVSTPLSGVDFSHRLPCGEAERGRLAMRVFFTMRSLSLQLRGEAETQLPLLKLDNLVHPGDALDLNNSDLLACTVTVSNEKTERLFLVLERDQLILVRPDALRMGWGICRLAGPLYDVDLSIDKDDGRSLHVTVHPVSLAQNRGTAASVSSSSGSVTYSRSIVSARFQFDDHIRCRAARERIYRGRQRVRLMKLQKVAALLEIPPEATSFGGSSVAGNSPTESAPPALAPHVLSMFNPKIQQAIMAASASTPLSSRAPFLPNSLSTPLFQNDQSQDKLATSNSTEIQQIPDPSKTISSSTETMIGQRNRSAAIIEQKPLTASTDSQLHVSSNSSSTTDIPGVLNADEHRRRFMQTLGVVPTPGASVRSPSLSPQAPKKTMSSDPFSIQNLKLEADGTIEALKLDEHPTEETTSPQLIAFEDAPQAVQLDEETLNRLVKSESDAGAIFADVSTERSNSDDSLILKKAIEELAASNSDSASQVPKEAAPLIELESAKIEIGQVAAENEQLDNISAHQDLLQ